MSKAEPERSHGEWRIWLRSSLRSGLLDRLPLLYEPAGMPTVEYAWKLLDQLRNPDPHVRPVREVIAEAKAFGVWVVACQKAARRTVLAERIGKVVEPALVIPYVPRNPPRRVAPPPQGSPRSNPMWDDLLDAP
jgi:hypothetical protein